MRQLTGLVVIVGLACQRTPSTDPVAVRHTIEQQNALAERWYRAGQADSLTTLFADSVWQMPPNMPPLVGRDSLRAFWSQAMKWGRWEFDLRTEDVITNGSVAVERGRYAVKFTPGAQAPIPASQDRGNYVTVWRRESDGQWRAVWDAPVSELPPPRAPR